MQLIAALAAGIRGAELGTVEIYARGTTSFAQVFTDAKGGGSQTPSAGIALDAFGGIELYVGQAVDCIAKDANGEIVRSFTEMAAAANVEIRSQSFTGTDYDDGGNATSFPVDAATVFDRWLDSAGTIDWNVLVGGVSTTLQAAFANLGAIFFNVKATTYGAVGDNSANDTSAIQAALDAAAVTGGVVFFPPGNYKITDTLTVALGVSLFGCGAQASHITIDHASKNAISFTDADATLRKRPQFMFGLDVTVGQNNSGKLIVCEAGAIVSIVLCCLGGGQIFSSNGTIVSIANAGSVVNLYGTTLRVDGASAFWIHGPAAGRAVAVGCQFIWGATTFTTGAPGNDSAVCVAGGCTLTGCVFDLANVNVALSTGCVMSSPGSLPLVISGCEIIAPSVITVIPPYRQDGSAPIREVGLAVGANMGVPDGPSGTTAASNHEGGTSTSWQTRRGFITDNSAAIVVPCGTYGIYEVRRTNNGNQDVSFDPPYAAGLSFTLVYNNDQVGASGTISPTGSSKGLASFTVNANRVSILHWKSYEVTAAGGGAGSFYWAYEAVTASVTL